MPNKEAKQRLCHVFTDCAVSRVMGEHCLVITITMMMHRVVMREVAGSNPGRINTQDLKITEEKVLPL